MAKKQSFGHKTKKKEQSELVVKVIKSIKTDKSYSFKDKLVKVSVEDGIDKVLSGKTTLQEILRVTHE